MWSPTSPTWTSPLFSKCYIGETRTFTLALDDAQKVNLRAQNLIGLQELDEFDSMTDVFGSSGPRDRMVHVLVGPPDGGPRKREDLDAI